MAITITEAFTSLEDVRRDLSDVTDAQKIRAANYINQMFYDEWIGIDPYHFVSEDTVNVVAGTTDYSLPADFQTINSFDCGIYEIGDDNKDTRNKLATTAFGSPLDGYYIQGANIVVTPEPVKAQNYKLRYIPALADMTDLADEFIVEDRHKELLRDALMVWYDVNDEDYAREGADDPRLARTMSRFANGIAKNAQIASLPNYNNSY